MLLPGLAAESSRKDRVAKQKQDYLKQGGKLTSRGTIPMKTVKKRPRAPLNRRL